jgi:hypothetical protein
VSEARLAADKLNTDDESIVICVQEPAPTGSHLGAHKECRSRVEWDAMHAESPDSINDGERKALQFNPKGS